MLISSAVIPSLEDPRLHAVEGAHKQLNRMSGMEGKGSTMLGWIFELFRRKAVSTTPNLMFHFVPTQIVNVFSG